MTKRKEERGVLHASVIAACAVRRRAMRRTSEKEALLKLKAPRDGAGGSTDVLIQS
jgi:hypothetical protein